MSGRDLFAAVIYFYFGGAMVRACGGGSLRGLRKYQA